MEKILGYVSIVFVAGITVVATLIGVSALFAWPVKLLYNYVMPHQFGLKEIDFLHAWALMVLCGGLFKSYTSCNCKKSKET